MDPSSAFPGHRGCHSIELGVPRSFRRGNHPHSYGTSMMGLPALGTVQWLQSSVLTFTAFCRLSGSSPVRCALRPDVLEIEIDFPEYGRVR